MQNIMKNVQYSTYGKAKPRTPVVGITWKVSNGSGRGSSNNNNNNIDDIEVVLGWKIQQLDWWKYSCSVTHGCNSFLPHTTKSNLNYLYASMLMKWNKNVKHKKELETFKSREVHYYTSKREENDWSRHRYCLYTLQSE